MAKHSIVRYYRTSTPETKAAWAAYVAESDALASAGAAFAAHFPGAKPVYANSAGSQRIYGLEFNPPMPTDVWTKPAADECNVQRPRSRLSNKVKEDRVNRLAELVRVRGIYLEHCPKGRASITGVFQALGTRWENLWLCGYDLHEREGVIYLATSQELAYPCVEITASEFDASGKGASHD